MLDAHEALEFLSAVYTNRDLVCVQEAFIAATEVATELTNPHWIDTNALPWIVDPAAPDR